MQNGPYRDGKVHVLSDKCSTCVFRPGNLMSLQSGRFKDLVESNRKNDTALSCHKTLYRDDVRPAVCRGYYDTFKDRITPLLLAQAYQIIEEDPVPGDHTSIEELEDEQQ